MNFLLDRADTVRLRDDRVAPSLFRRIFDRKELRRANELLAGILERFPPMRKASLRVLYGDDRVYDQEYNHYFFKVTPAFKKVLLNGLKEGELDGLTDPVFYRNGKKIAYLVQHESLYVLSSNIVSAVKKLINTVR